MLDQRSANNLVGVHPDLIRVVTRARTITPFTVIFGVRTAAQQLDLWRKGASRLNGIPRGQVVNGVRGTGVSRHQTGHAVDVVLIANGKAYWDAASYDRIQKAFFSAAAVEKVNINWGGHWKSFVDKPHFELPTKEYP